MCFNPQQNSAADLSMLVLEVLEKSEAKVEDEILGEWQPLAFKRHLTMYKTSSPKQYILMSYLIVYSCRDFLSAFISVTF